MTEIAVPSDLSKQTRVNENSIILCNFRTLFTCMHLIKQSKVQLLIAFSFILGIVCASVLEPHLFSVFTLWCTCFLALMVLIISGRNIFALRQTIGVLICVVFFFSGMLGTTLQFPKNQTTHYVHQFLPGDQLLVEITEFQEGDGNFDKGIVNVLGVLTETSKQPATGKLLCYFRKGRESKKVGQRWVIGGSLLEIKNKNNPGEFNQEAYWRNKGVKHITFLNENEIKYIDFHYSAGVFWNQLRNYLKRQLKRVLNENHYAVAVALSLGDKSELPKETRSAFSSAGAMHVLAVSGLHVGILLTIIQWICFRIPFLRKRQLYIVISIFVVWFFAFLMGLSPSVFRAATMFSVLAIGQLTGKSILSLSSLVMSGILLLIIQPLYLFDIGFQLSYIAMFGIVFFFQPVSNLFYFKQKWMRFIWDGTAIGIAAQIGTLPATLYYFHQFPNYFILTNVGFLVLGFLALGSVLFFFVVHAIPFVSDVVAYLVSWVFEIVIQFVTFIERLPISLAVGFELSWGQLFVAYTLILLLWWQGKKLNLRSWRRVALVMMLFICFIQFNRWNNQLDGELIVLNNYRQTIVWKQGNRAICLHDAALREEKLRFSLENYEKLKGVDVEFHVLPKFNKQEERLSIQLGAFDLEVRAKRGANSIFYQQHEFIFPYRNVDIPQSDNVTVVTGEWSRNYKGESDVDTSNGAVYLFS